MRVIGVIDLRGGQAVHARGGVRERYAPIAAVDGNAGALARRYLEAGVRELYVADLDAIDGRDRQNPAVRDIVGLGAPVWLDAGASSTSDARRCLDVGAAQVIVGLETLTSFDHLQAICDDIGGHRVAFSLDLRDGQPVGSSDDAETIASRAAAAGVGAIIVLDLARVGMNTGLDLGVLRRIRSAVPDVAFLAGGGVRGQDDLIALAAIGCTGALAATALLEGQIISSR